VNKRILTFLRGKEARRIGRFLVVGGGLFTLDLTLFLVLVKLAGLDVWWAQTISVSIRTALGFVLHKWFTFAGDTKTDASSTAKQSVAYIIQGLINIPISAAVVTGCVWATGGYALIGKVMSEAVLAVWVFFLYRFVVWRPQPDLTE
jgi:putative flippase GtrA